MGLLLVCVCGGGGGRGSKTGGRAPAIPFCGVVDGPCADWEKGIFGEWGCPRLRPAPRCSRPAPVHGVPPPFISGNPIGDRGVIPLCQALSCNAALLRLNLSATGLGAQGAQALAMTLTANRALRTLLLHDNALGEAGVCALARATGPRHWASPPGATTVRNADVPLVGESTEDCGDSGCENLVRPREWG